MASFTLQSSGRFPVGTSVSAYKRSNWPGSQQGSISGAPVGSSDDTKTVQADGSLAFTTLTDNTKYVAYASVGGEDRYVGFITGSDTATSGGVSVNTELPSAQALSDAIGNPTTPVVGVAGLIFNPGSGQWQRWNSGTGDGRGGGETPGVGAMLYRGDFTWDRPRTPTTFKSLASTAITAGTGATIWTPTAGKKFRVMGVSFSTSVAGQLLLGDNAVGTVIARSPSLAAGGVWQLGAADMGNGILSAAINNVLKLDGPTGNVMGMVFGTEE